MRLNITPITARVGNVEINALSRVTELDAGDIIGPNKYSAFDDGTSNVTFSNLSLQTIEKQLAIIIPCMNEAVSILSGVLHGIPHACLIILVSNSNPSNYKAECTMLTDFCTDTQRHGIAIHQQDLDLARAFAAAGMPHIVEKKIHEKKLDSAGRIRNGKGEAMMIGTALAKLAGKRFIGFIDADNLIPGAVHEYCKVFAAGLCHALDCSGSDGGQEGQKPLAIVRIKWKSKPKIVDGKLVPIEAGRCSRVVNGWMNRLLTSITGNPANGDLIKTANAGEHAMSIDLALRLNFATGYAVEPFQLVDMWERSCIFPPPTPATPAWFGIAKPTSVSPALLDGKVKVLQIETLNPQIHDFSKGDDHILCMQAQGLSTIYHSKLTPPNLQDELKAYMKEHLASVVGEDGQPELATVYPPMKVIDFDVFGEVLNEVVVSKIVGGC